MTATTNPRLAVAWIGELDGYLQLLDQTRLPTEVVDLPCQTVEVVWEAIRKLSVRGAPAIGVAAAYGTVVGCQTAVNESREAFNCRFGEVVEYLAGSRPTAVNLFWALDRMKGVAASHPSLGSQDMLQRLLDEARLIETEDREMCAAIGRHGAPLLANCTGVLTHCNTGGLATAGDGTALAVIFAAAAANPELQVYADETRPLLQGARLTAWELLQRGVNTRLICDSMAGWVMKEGRVQAVIVGADRIAANGDSANKIGTYSLSVLAKAHGIPFYIAAPSSTFDFAIRSGAEIPIEQRSAEEITNAFGRRTAPENCPVYNPAFDVAPAENITGLVTEKGVISPVTEAEIRRVLGK
ncbi:S-methyl-5-thioribose-1-phosphate isomerase [Planctellipticum variicoloris]|uniref:S-methyl-5-thioribose-1-phosphate isomerase n=1 Tax=Planctellipticum variicoloris TaxID=3064265 RepID=UPI0030138186|nr:S-methyl-5-thioribose-1-phosphate isomerase [Planctomycetaceae bacterium SH412]